MPATNVPAGEKDSKVLSPLLVPPPVTEDGAAKAAKTPRTPVDLEDLYRDLPLTDDTTCGISFIRGPWLQR